MKKSKFSESQIVAILKEGEAGVAVEQILRKHGISRATYYGWKSKYGGASVTDLKRLKELEAEPVIAIGHGRTCARTHAVDLQVEMCSFWRSAPTSVNESRVGIDQRGEATWVGGYFTTYPRASMQAANPRSYVERAWPRAACCCEACCCCFACIACCSFTREMTEAPTRPAAAPRPAS
jgi:putative transposase